MSPYYYRRGRNPIAAMGILLIVIGSIALVRQLIIWTEGFVLQFLFNSEINSEKIAVTTIAGGLFLVYWGFKKRQ